MLENFAAQRAAFKNEMDILRERLSFAQLKMDRLDRAEAAYRGLNYTTFKSVGPALAVEPKPDIRKKTLTIKDMVLNVLADFEDGGLVALDILKEINERYEREYVRTSLSPQLSRLMQSNQIRRVGKRWILGPSKITAEIKEDKEKTAALPTPPSS